MDDYVESDASVAATRPRARPVANMAGRLGRVLAWTANVIAAAVLVIGTIFILVAWDNMGRENTPALVWQRDRADNWHFVVREPIRNIVPGQSPRLIPVEGNPFEQATLLSINVLQAGVSAALLIAVMAIWAVGRPYDTS